MIVGIETARWYVRFTARTREGDEDCMSEWIDERYKRHQQREADATRKRQFDENAVGAYGGMFQALQNQIERDIQRYQQLFGKNQACAASVHKYSEGFSVVCQDRTVAIKRTHGTVIKIEYFDPGSPPDHPSRSDFIEVAADDAGHIRYKHAKAFLNAAEDAAQMILDPVLCS